MRSPPRCRSFARRVVGASPSCSDSMGGAPVSQPTHSPKPRPVASTGVAGLDDILAGGLTRRRVYLIEGVPGSGKTTLALQFLIAGAKAGEAVLYITLSETEEELRSVADSHGWQLEGIAIRELTPPEAALDS